MPTLYHGHYSGWTRSKEQAVSAACKGTREDGGGVEEVITEHQIPEVTLLGFVMAMNGNADVGVGRVVARIQNGRKIAEI